MLKETYGSDKKWVNWKLEKNKDGDLTKIPYNPHTKGKAMSNNPDTWGTYNQARSVSDKIGIVFADDNRLVIDIDHCIENGEIVHPQKEEIEKFLALCNTYTELSPSMSGLHIWLQTESKYELITKKHKPWEVYNSGRFMTVTEIPYKNYIRPIRKLTTEETTALLNTIGYPWIKETRPIQQSTISTTLSDQDVLNIMFRSKNGKAIEQLYNTTGGKGSSEDDAKLCTHLAFYCDTYEQIERLWLQSPLGSRAKTTEREDYRKRTITGAMKACTAHYSPSVQTIQTKQFIKEMPEDLKFIEDHKGQPIMNTENVIRILKGHPEFTGRLRYDKFKNVLQIFRDNEWEETKDYESINLQTRISVLFPAFAKIGKLMVEDALNKVIHDNEICSVPDFIKSLTWDKEPRLDAWLSHAFGVAEDEYHQKVGSNWMKGLVKRAINPGAKFDNVLVLEGSQGIKKSQALAMLGNINGQINHLETTMNAGNKDFFMSFVGKLIVEFSEGETLTRSETKQIKGIITTCYDNYREPYARKSKDHPRWCVFAMTTNEDTYLKDDTGNRRWLPVKVLLDECNIKWIEENREQLYAEAYYRVITLKETYWEFPKEALEEAQDDRRVDDTNADIVVDWYKNKLLPFEREIGVSTRDVYDEVIAKRYSNIEFTTYEMMRIAGILRGTLRLTLKRVMVNGTKVNKYFDTQNRYHSVSKKPEEDKKEIKRREEPYADEFIEEEINKITTQWE